jgi:hypothetical protein
VARSFNRRCERALMLGTRAQLAPWLDLAALRDVSAQARNVLVVDFANVVDAEAADLPPSAETATTTPAWSATTTSGRAPASGTALPWRGCRAASLRTSGKPTAGSIVIRPPFDAPAIILIVVAHAVLSLFLEIIWTGPICAGPSP